MNWIESILILSGISSEIFAIMECQGSMMAKVEKKNLTKLCVVAGLFQSIALFCGYLLSGLLVQKDGIVADEVFVGSVLAGGIFFCLGIRLLYHAIKNEFLDEKREDRLRMKAILNKAAITAMYTFFAGVAFGFIGTNLYASVGLIAVFTVLVVIGGLYTGYHFGFQQKRMVYILGTILFWLVGAEIPLRYIGGLF